MKRTGLRPRPSDFRSTYIEVGKPGCEAHYGAHWKTVDRWVEEEGKVELRKARADYVSEQRKKRTAVLADGQIRTQPEATCDPDELHAACAYLRENRNGGWRVGLRSDGRYFVGSAACGPAEVIERAKAKGMDEWYVEADIMKRLSLSDVDEWVLDCG